MVRLRLTRMGSKKKPYYRIIAIDKRKPRDSRYLDLIGYYQPLAEPDNQLKINEEKVKSWLSNGATVSDSVKPLLKRQGISVS